MNTHPLCRGCTVVLTADQDSDAHIIPNALGGRLAPRGFLCRSANSALNELADKPLIEAFGPWPTLLDIPRDRATNPPVVIETTTGMKIRQESDGTRTRADLVYDVTPLEEGHAVDIAAPTWTIMKQRINQAAKQFPQLDPAVAIAHAKEVGILPTGLERITVDFHPSKVFPGILAALWLFGIYKASHELMSWPALIKQLVRIRSGHLFPGFRYLPDGLPGLTGPDIPISHKLVLRTVPSKGLLIGYAEILGTLRVGGILAKGPRDIVEEHVYVADVFGRTERTSEYVIDAAIFDGVDWETVGLGPADAPPGTLRSYVESAQAPLVKCKYERDSRLATGRFA